MNQETVDRIPDKDSKTVKALFLAFFLLTPLLGLLFFWFDGHAKIQREAKGFVEREIIPVMKEGGDLIDFAEPELADKIRGGSFAWVREELGSLKATERLSANESHAREEDDRGVIYAEVDFTGKYDRGNARIHLVIKRQSMPDERGLSERERQREEWAIVEMAVTKNE